MLQPGQPIAMYADKAIHNSGEAYAAWSREFTEAILPWPPTA